MLPAPGQGLAPGLSSPAPAAAAQVKEERYIEMVDKSDGRRIIWFSDVVDFILLINRLTKESAQQVTDLTPPVSQKHEPIKARILTAYEESETGQIHEHLCKMELGDQQPSQLLQRMRYLAGKKVPDETIKTVWLSHLPPSMRNIVLLMETRNLEQMGEMADMVIEIYEPDISKKYGWSPASAVNMLSFRSQPFPTVSYSPPPDLSEVYPGLYVGDVIAGTDKLFLRRMRITHVLNTAEEDPNAVVHNLQEYYLDMPGMRYEGFSLLKMPTTDRISKYLHIAANFIDEGVSSGGRVLVHGIVGESRSATCALAFLMMKRGMTLAEALVTVRSRRYISPAQRLLRQLQQLDRELRASRVRQPLTPISLVGLSRRETEPRRVRSLDGMHRYPK